DQGVAYGSCWGNIHHYGYSLRDMYPAYFLMKDVLRKAGKLAEAERTMIWYAQTNEVYIRPVINGMDMDTFNTAASGCMASILLMEDSPEKVQYLRSMARWLDCG
ncbi:chondroitinase, partial [Bacillus pumilus]